MTLPGAAACGLAVLGWIALYAWLADRKYVKDERLRRRAEYERERSSRGWE